MTIKRLSLALVLAVLFISLFTNNSSAGDCPAVASAAPPEPVPHWTRQHGGEAEERGVSIARGSDGCVVVLSVSTGPAGEEGGALIKYGPSGGRLWLRRLGTEFHYRPAGVAVDGDGGVYVAGGVRDVLPGLGGEADAFVTKLDSDGGPLWTWRSGAAGDDSAAGVATWGGRVYVAGNAAGGDGDDRDCFVTALSTRDGGALWAVRTGTGEREVCAGAACDAAGNVYVAGATCGGLYGENLSGPNCAAADGAPASALFVAKYDKDGQALWGIQSGAGLSETPRGLAASPAGEVYLTGLVGGGYGGADCFLKKFSASGEELWDVRHGSEEYDAGKSVCLDAAGDVYVAGLTFGGLDGNVQAGGGDIFVSAYTPAGERAWTKTFGSALADEAAAITGMDEGFALTGLTAGGLEGGGTNGGDDVITMRLGPPGSAPPWSEIVSPARGRLAGDVVPVSVRAYAGSGVAMVEVSIDGGYWSAAAYNPETSLWEYLWTAPSEGEYVIRSRASDSSGKVEEPGEGVRVSYVKDAAAGSAQGPGGSPGTDGACDLILYSDAVSASGGAGSGLVRVSGAGLIVETVHRYDDPGLLYDSGVFYDSPTVAFGTWTTAVYDTGRTARPLKVEAGVEATPGVSCALSIDYSEDGSAWSGWTAMPAGEVIFRYFRIKAEVSSADPSSPARLTGLGISVYECPPPPPQVIEYYGSGIAMQTLIPNYVGRVGTAEDSQKAGYRFGADHTGYLDSFKIYWQWAGGYGAGTGGSAFSVEVIADDGTELHYPSPDPGDVLASRTWVPAHEGVDKNFPAIAFSPRPRLYKGGVYHVVFTNLDANPIANWSSTDNFRWSMDSEPNRQPTLDDIFASLKYLGAKGGWTAGDYPGEHGNGPQGGVTPIFQCSYDGGAHKAGIGYIELMAEKAIGGAAKVREVFTVSGGDRKVAAAHFCESVPVAASSTGGPLVCRLERLDGSGWTLVEEAAAVPEETHAPWHKAVFSAPVTLENGRAYNLVWLAAEGSEYKTKAVKRGKEYHFDPATYFRDGHAEYTTDGATWKIWENRRGTVQPECDLSFYFDVVGD